jgi:hypothetical protein
MAKSKLSLRDWLLGVPALFTWYVLDRWNKPYRNGKKRGGQKTYTLKAQLRLLARFDRFIWRLIGG